MRNVSSGSRIKLGVLLLLICGLAPSTSCSRSAQRPETVLRVACLYELATLDPHADNSLEGFEQVSNIYEPLIALDRNLLLVPALATSWSTPNPTTWTFHLREDVYFHDGSPLMAEDVAYTIMRLKSDESLTLRSQITGVTSATVENGEAVVRTAYPSARLLYDLTQVLIVRKGSTRSSLDSKPNGTGPYAVESWRNPRLLLHRNDRYWGPKPDFSRIEVETATDESVTEKIRKGEVSIVRTTFADTETAAKEETRYRIVRQMSPYLLHLGMNVSMPTLPNSNLPNPFRIREVRQALDLALARDRIGVGSLNKAPTSHIIPSDIFGHDPNIPETKRDVAGARRLLESAGYADGFDVDLHAIRATKRPQLRDVQQQLAEAGIRIHLVDAPSVPGFFEGLRRRELPFWVVADAAITGEAGWLLSCQFHSADPARDLGTDNYGGYADVAVDRAIEEADATFNTAERQQILQKAVRLAQEQHWWIPLYRSEVLYIVDRTLQFEPRDDLYIRYAEISSSTTPE